MINNIRNILESTTVFFKQKNIQPPRLNAELLLADTLNYPNRLDLYLDFDKILLDNEIKEFKEKIRERINGKPVQYILGYTDFYNYRLRVNESVLIPRPETELLIEKTIQLAKQQFPKEKQLYIADIGTGSGAIIINLLSELNCQFGFAVDLSMDALSLAKENFHSTITEKPLYLIQGNLLNSFKNNSFDIIISNPPYVALREWEKLDIEVKNFEPQLALKSGKNGLGHIKNLIENAKNCIKPGGWMIIEIGENQKEPIEKILQKNQLSNYRFEKDLNRKYRYLFINIK